MHLVIEIGITRLNHFSVNWLHVITVVLSRATSNCLTVAVVPRVPFSWCVSVIHNTNTYLSSRLGQNYYLPQSARKGTQIFQIW